MVNIKYDKYTILGTLKTLHVKHVISVPKIIKYLYVNSNECLVDVCRGGDWGTRVNAPKTRLLTENTIGTVYKCNTQCKIITKHNTNEQFNHTVINFYYNLSSGSAELDSRIREPTTALFVLTTP